MEERSDKEQQHITKHHNTKHNKRETTTQNKNTMGNRSSRTVDASVIQSEGDSNTGNSEVTAVTQSGVFLANELQCKYIPFCACFLSVAVVVSTSCH
jgi:hypothetical protein